MFDRISQVPNFFYDFIVYFTPTIGLAIGIFYGINGSFVFLEDAIKDLGALGTFIAIFLLVFASYEYGRLAETYSDIFVGKVARRCCTWKLLRNPDYQRKLTFQVAQLPIDIQKLDGRVDSKWSIYFFAVCVNSDIGSDLLKRYAWEKLARSSGFTALVLFCVSAISYLMHLVLFRTQQLTPGEFGGWGYTLVTGFLYVILLYDFYKRNCWNNDLIMTTLPVLVASFNKAGTLLNQTKAPATP